MRTRVTSRNRRDVRGRHPIKARLLLERLEDRTLPHSGLSPSAALYLPPQYHLFEDGGYLTGPSAEPGETIARNYLRSRAADLGLLPADLDGLRVTTNYVTNTTGVTHLTLQQSLHDMDVANANFNVNVTADGRVLNAGGGFVPRLSARAGAPAPTPVLRAPQAVAAAADALDLTLTDEPVVVQANAGASSNIILRAPSVSLDDVTARLHYVAAPNNGVSLSWELVLRPPDGEHWYNVNVDSSTGQVTALTDYVSDASYQVFERPKESPYDGPRTVQNDPQVISPVPAVAPSPFGWHDSNGIPGAEFTNTRGNNVNAQVPGTPRPDGGAGLNFNFPMDLTQPPTTHLDATVANLFYWTNVLHDVHYLYGFNEASRNFQVNNYGRGGAGNDPVTANARPGCTNNAFMGTPPDGSSPTMSMCHWTFTTPHRESALDAGVIAHEFGHGVSNRLTGNASGLNAIQSRGMGEGWSDWWGLMFTQKTAGETATGRGIGTYVLGQPPGGVGIRQYRYNFNITNVNLETFRHFNTPGGSAVHTAGTRWSSTLWDLNHLLIQKHGYEPNLYNSTSSAGNIRTMHLVTNGLKLQPLNPSFIQARDAILAADNVVHGGANRCEIWTAFARRGLGQGAFTASSNSTSLTTSFVVPVGACGLAITSSVPANNSVVTTQPTNFVIDFSDPINTSSVQAGDLRVNGLPSDLPPVVNDADTVTFRFSSSPVMSQGLQTMTIAADAITRTSDGDGNDAFTATFRYDVVPMQLTADPPNGTVFEIPQSTLIMDVNSNEPMAPGSVDLNDLTVSRGIVTAVEIIGPQQVRYTIDTSGIATEGVLNFAIAAGAYSDAFGNPNLPLSGSYVFDFGEVALPPFTAKAPLGSLIYDPPQPGVIGSVGDMDTFLFNLDGQQLVTVVVDPASTLRPTIELFGPESSLGTASSAANGRDVVLQTIAIPGPGSYAVVVGAVGNTTGAYGLQVILNAAAESEKHNGPANNTMAAAQDLHGSLITLGGPGSRGAVLGRADPGNVPDWYSFILSEGDTVTLAVTALTTGAHNVRLVDPDGNDVGLGILGPSNVRQVIRDFRATAAGTYFAVVTGSANTDYSLVLTRNAEFDLEPNDVLARSQPLLSQQVDGEQAVLGHVGTGMAQLGNWRDHAHNYSDVWAEGNFAYLGHAFNQGGVDIIDISNPANPTFVATFRGTANNEIRDLHVQNGIGFFSSDSGGGVYVVDVRDPRNPRQLYRITSADGGYNSVHTVTVEGDYLYESDSRTPRVKVFNISDPSRPRFVRDIVSPSGGPVHEATARNGRLYTAVISGAGRCDVFDISNVEADAPLLTTFVTGSATHTSWPTDDGQFVVVARETGGGDIGIWDIRDLAAPTRVSRIVLPTSQSFSAHQPVVVGNRLYTAWYQAGLLVHDITDPANPVLLGQFDTFPGPVSGFNGAWGVYPFLGDERILVADITTGLHILSLGEQDLYSISLGAGAIVELSTSTPADGPGEFFNGLDPRLRLLNAAGTAVATDDNSAPDGRNARLSFTVPPGGAGTYFVNVSPSPLTANPTTGEYILSVKGNTVVMPDFRVTASLPANGARVRGPTTFVTVDFNDAVLLSSLDVSDLTVNGEPATDFTVVDGDTVRFSFPGLAEGNHDVAIAAAAILDVQQTPLQALAMRFYNDVTPPRVVSSSVQEGQVLTMSGPTQSLTYTVQFSEPMRRANLDATDFSLRGVLRNVFYSSASFSYNAAGDILTLNYANLPDDRYTLTLLSANGRFEDDAITNGWNLDGETIVGGVPVWPIPPGVSGNGVEGGNFVVNFTLDVVTVPYPTPVVAKLPLGSLIYDPSVSAAIGSADDTDSFTLDVDTGQTITVLVDPGTTLRPTIELFDPFGTLIGSAAGTVNGNDVVLQTVTVFTEGAYTITVGSAAGTTGFYTAQLTLNAALELEKHNGAANNTLATAQDINASFTALPKGAGRGAVLGRTDISAISTFVTHIYDLNGTFADSLGGPAMVPNGGTLGPAGYTFGFGQGPNLTGAISPATYSIEMVVRIDQTSSWRRLVDFKNRTSDNGFYNLDGSLQLFPQPPGPVAITAGQLHHLVVTRNAATNQFLGYVDGVQRLNVIDSALNAEFSGPGNIIHFLRDDGSENASGFLDRVRIYEGVLTPVQVVALSGGGPPPTAEPVPDWYQFTIPDGPSQNVTLAVKGLASGTLTLELRDGSGGVLATGAGGAANLDRLIHNFGPLAPDTYFARVTGSANLDYSLVITHNAVFDREPNGTSANAQDFTGTAGSLGALATAADVDWYRVSAAGGETLIFETLTPADGPGQFVNTLDPRIDLFDPAGNPVGTREILADGRNERITITVPDGGDGVYRIRVTAEGGTRGEYFLDPFPVAGGAGPAPVGVTRSSILELRSSKHEVLSSKFDLGRVADLPRGPEAAAAIRPATVFVAVVSPAGTPQAAPASRAGQSTLLGEVYGRAEGAGPQANAEGQMTNAETMPKAEGQSSESTWGIRHSGLFRHSAFDLGLSPVSSLWRQLADVLFALPNAESEAEGDQALALPDILGGPAPDPVVAAAVFAAALGGAWRPRYEDRDARKRRPVLR